MGIERDIKDEARKTDQQISEAFTDLKSLMEMAKPMVQLAKKISDKQAVVSVLYFNQIDNFVNNILPNI